MQLQNIIDLEKLSCLNTKCDVGRDLITPSCLMVDPNIVFDFALFIAKYICGGVASCFLPMNSEIYDLTIFSLSQEVS